MINSLLQTPFIPKGWEIDSHILPPPSYFGDEKLVMLCVYGRQEKGSWETGHDIRHMVKNPLNACVLDYLLDHQDSIPPNWAGKLVFFWGTIYKVKQPVPFINAEKKTAMIPIEKLFVRCLLKSGGEWVWDSLCLDDEFGFTRVSAEIKLPNWWQRLIAKFK
jgi:hypothetical protein